MDFIRNKIQSGFRLFAVLTTAVLLAGMGGCNQHRGDYYRYQGFALGTTYNIIVADMDTAGMQSSIDSLFEISNASMSLYDENSLLSKINRGETDSLDRHIEYCIKVARRISEMSEGLYDITVKPLSQAYGFLSLNPQADINIDSLLQFVGYQKIEVENGRLIRQAAGVELDLNSIAKGYIVDLMAQLIKQKGSDNYMVEIGGEVMCEGVNPKGKKWLIGIDTPYDGNIVPGQKLQAKVSLSNKGLATSGNYRKYYYDNNGRKVVHTINPLTGESVPSNLLSATVVAENATTADALATMLMTMGVEGAMTFLQTNTQFPSFLIYDDGEGEYETFATKEFNELMVR